MNIALSALIISILLLPGAVSLTAYYTSLRERSSAFVHIPFSELLLKGIILSFFIHCCGICIVRAMGRDANFQFLYDILIGNKFSVTNSFFTHTVLQFFSYTLSLIVISFIFTKIFKWFVLRNFWDVKFNNLKSSNYWHLIFSGRLLDNRKRGKRDLTDLIYVDILAENDIIYSGFLYDFTYSPQKDILENIVLKTAAKRTYLKSEGEGDLKLNSATLIPGDIFIIPGKDIVNINVYYVKFSDKNKAQKSSKEKVVKVS